MEWGAQSVEENTRKPEQVTFGLPKALAEAPRTAAGSSDSSHLRPDGG
jgi:hypothetical protein